MLFEIQGKKDNAGVKTQTASNHQINFSGVIIGIKDEEQGSALRIRKQEIDGADNDDGDDDDDDDDDDDVGVEVRAAADQEEDHQSLPPLPPHLHSHHYHHCQ